MLVRYDRKEMQVWGEGRLYGRAYPSVYSFEDFSQLAGVLSLTALPRHVHNTLVSYPKPLLVDMDMARCYPSIMLALAGMHGLEGAIVGLLGAYACKGPWSCGVWGEQGGGL